MIIALCDRLIFSGTVQEEVRFGRDDLIYARTEIELLGWQEELMRILPPPQTDEEQRNFINPENRLGRRRWWVQEPRESVLAPREKGNF